MQYLKSLFSLMNNIVFLKKHIIAIKTLFATLILSSFVFLLSCTDTGDEFQTFLEKNDGTEWLLSNDNLTVYIRLNNNSTPHIEQWYYTSEFKCFEYNPNIFIPGDCKIKENSIDTLIVEGDLFLSDYEYMTFTTQGNTLKVDITLDECQEETVYFTKSSVWLDNLETCVQVEKEQLRFYHSCINRD